MRISKPRGCPDAVIELSFVSMNCSQAANIIHAMAKSCLPSQPVSPNADELAQLVVLRYNTTQASSPWVVSSEWRYLISVKCTQEWRIV